MKAFFRELRYGYNVLRLFLGRKPLKLVARRYDDWETVTKEDPWANDYYVCIESGDTRTPLPIVLNYGSSRLQKTAFWIVSILNPIRMRKAQEMCANYQITCDISQAEYRVRASYRPLERRLEKLEAWELDDLALRGHPSHLDKIQLAAIKGQIKPLVPLFQRVFEAKRADKRPPEGGSKEDASLYWGWHHWSIAQTGKSGMGVPIWSLYVETKQAKVKVAEYFGGDRCNAPGTYAGWDRA